MAGELVKAVEPVRLTWELTTPASMDKVWEVASDTDGFNRLAKLDFRYTEEPQTDGTTRRVGQTRRLGVLSLVWDEMPAQYRSPEWYRFIRRFRGSPVTEVNVLLRLRSTESGTALRYSVEAFPRAWWLRPIVALEMHLFTRPQLDAALGRLLSALAAQERSVDPPPPPLGLAAEGALAAGLAQLTQPSFGLNLASFVRSAPLREQDRMHPLKWARTWKLTEAEVVQGCLQAVQRGLLTLHWDVVCPNCLGAKQRPQSLGELQRKVHCPSCNVFFDATFPDSLAVSFRTAPALRRFEVPVECASSPGRQSHVVGQDTLPPGEEVAFSPHLQVGQYRLRSWPPIDTAVLEVVPGAPPAELRLSATDQGFAPVRLKAPPGQTTIKVRNTLGRELTVILERRWRPADVLTVGRLLEMPGARELIPDESLLPETHLRTRRGVVLAMASERGKGGEDFAKVLAGLGVSHSLMGNDGVLCVFETTREAVDLLVRLQERYSFFAGLTLGPVIEMDLAAGPTVVGAAVDEALTLLRGSLRDMVAVPSRLEGEAELLTALSARGISLVPARYVLPGGLTVHWLSFEG